MWSDRVSLLGGEIERVAEVEAPKVLRPSEYTSAMMQVLFDLRPFVSGAAVLEIGSGSGVVLAALASMGAARLCGIDIEESAIRAGETLLRATGTDAAVEFLRGDTWRPVAGRRFDLITANLPHFPTQSADFPGRLPSWSDGGQDGRRVLDPFLDGLARHLAPGGRAIITHNGFVDLAQTRRRLAEDGLEAWIVRTELVPLPAEKLTLMSEAIRNREQGRTLLQFGPYCFGTMYILDIRAGDTPAGRAGL